MHKLFKITLLLIGLIYIVFLQEVKAQMSYQEKEALISAYFKEGSKAYNKRNNSLALYWFQKALVIDPEDDATLAMASIACGNKELYACAIYYAKKSLEVREHATTYNNLGITYGTLGYDNLALEAAKMGEKNSSNRYITQGVILYRHGKFRESIDMMRKATEFGSPETPFFNIGVTLHETGYADSVIYYFDKSIAANPNYPFPYLMKAVVLKESGKSKDEYQPLCKKVIELTSKKELRKRCLDTRAKAYELLEKQKEMEEELQTLLTRLNKLVELHPDAYPFIADRGKAYAQLGNKEKAIEDFRKALSINPNFVEIKNELNKLLNK